MVKDVVSDLCYDGQLSKCAFEQIALRLTSRFAGPLDETLGLVDTDAREHRVCNIFRNAGFRL